MNKIEKEPRYTTPATALRAHVASITLVIIILSVIAYFVSWQIGALLALGCLFFGGVNFHRLKNIPTESTIENKPEQSAEMRTNPNLSYGRSPLVAAVPTDIGITPSSPIETENGASPGLNHTVESEQLDGLQKIHRELSDNAESNLTPSVYCETGGEDEEKTNSATISSVVIVEESQSDVNFNSAVGPELESYEGIFTLPDNGSARIHNVEQVHAEQVLDEHAEELNGVLNPLRKLQFHFKNNFLESQNISSSSILGFSESDIEYLKEKRIWSALDIDQHLNSLEMAPVKRQALLTWSQYIQAQAEIAMPKYLPAKVEISSVQEAELPAAQHDSVVTTAEARKLKDIARRANLERVLSKKR